MKRDDLKKIISDCCNDVIFNYNNKKSGITSEVLNGIPKFQAWHGSEVKEYDLIDDLITDKFFSGKSLFELLEIVTFTII